MSDSFHDRLASLCAPEISTAMKRGDLDAMGEVITALATMLGRTIARSTGGDAKATAALLEGTQLLVDTEAAGMAGIMAFVQSRKGGA